MRALLLAAEIGFRLLWASFLSGLVPFQIWRKLLGSITGPTAENIAIAERQEDRARALGQMIEKVADRLPIAPPCLPRAMAGRWLLKSRRIPSRIVFGTRRAMVEEDGEKLVFHAWLQAGNSIVVGRAERKSFVAFSRPPDAAP